MTDKHTSGPLQYAFEGGTVAYIVEADGTTVAKLSVTENSAAHSALAANARLFSAAPELLEALEAIIAHEAHLLNPRRVDAARAAIARATGA